MALNPLSNLLLGNANDSSWITADGVSLDTLKNDIRKALWTLRSNPKKDIALFHSDTYQFLVWLLSAWQDKRSVLLPVEKNIASNHDLSNFLKIGEFDHPDIRAWGPDHISQDDAFSELTQDFQAISVFTSGTTGKPVRIQKSIRQLESEVAALEQTFGKGIASNAIFNRSVSHQHFFGFPFGVLWPLSRGSAFSREVVQLPQKWDKRIAQVFITSPSFLKGIANSPAVKMNPEWQIQAIFCAGGVLEKSVAKKVMETTSQQLYEMYGSSETGHISWRKGVDETWHLQAGVEIKKPIHHVLEIKSPFLPDGEWFATSDQATQKGESFELLGRVDQIIKVEGTRISLTLLEKSIKESGLVDDCIIADMDHGNRLQLGAALILNAQGLEILMNAGKIALVDQIKLHLKSKIHSIAIPRRWQFIDKYPLNNIGKVSKKAIEALFQPNKTIPLVIHRSCTEHSADLLLNISSDLACLEGHFQNFPLIPGVAQIDWAIDFGKKVFDLENAFSGMSQVKFQHVLKPNQPVHLTLEWDPNALIMLFKYVNAKHVFSTGRIRFAKVNP